MGKVELFWFSRTTAILRGEEVYRVAIKSLNTFLRVYKSKDWSITRQPAAKNCKLLALLISKQALKFFPNYDIALKFSILHQSEVEKLKTCAQVTKCLI